MARIDEKIAATKFNVPTRLSFDEVLALADKAAEGASKTLVKVVRADPKPSGDSIRYVVKRSVTGGLMSGIANGLEVGDFLVRIKSSADAGTSVVEFVPGSYQTVQQRVMLIPVAPKQSAALKPFESVSSVLKAAVSRS